MVEVLGSELESVLLKGAHGLVVLMVERGIVRASSHTAGMLLGERPIVGEALANLFDEPSRAKLGKIAAAHTPGVWELEIDGCDQPTLVRFVVIPHGDQQLFIGAPCEPAYTRAIGQRLIGLNDEVTNAMRELSRRAAHLERIKSELEQVGQMRDQFLATMSHDLKSPLSAAKLLAAMLRRTADTISRADLVARATSLERILDRTLTLVARVLDAARLEAGTLRLERELVRVDEVASEVVSMLEPVAAERGVHIAFRARGEPLIIHGDAVRLFEVICNLVDNAVRHSPDDDQVDVDLDRREPAARIVCRIRDRGSGVPPEERHRIFDRYAQAGETRRGSAGLGLYIARQLVELHGGKVWLEDGNPGAVFVIELPSA